MFHSGNDLLHFSSQELWSEQGYSFSQKKTTNSLLPLSPLGKHSVMPTFHLPPRVGQRHGREDKTVGKRQKKTSQEEIPVSCCSQDTSKSAQGHKD